jgi:hypothetical protein
MEDYSIKCKVVDQNDKEYKPIAYPPRPGSFMLEPCEPGEVYIFPSHTRAQSAIAHTMDWMTAHGIKWYKGEFIKFDIATGKTSIG